MVKNSAEANRQFFNRLAPTWEPSAELSSVRDEIVLRAKFPVGAVILDAGCGTGVMVPHLLKTDPKRLLELDVSDEMIRLNREKWEKAESEITFICGDLLNMKLPAIDAAIIFNAYPHFVDKIGLAQTLARHLPAGGIAVIAHSSGRKEINHIHKDSNPCEQISTPLRAPAEEFQPYEPYFTLDDWEDSQRIYFIKMIRK